MCGIFAIISQDKYVSHFVSSAKKAVDALSHRGPDDAGLFIHPHAILGHRRLSIIDLKGGNQPMLSSDGRYCIIYNGEIFNHNEIREKLIVKGHKFLTKSDTEVILHVYEEYGEDSVQLLRGMFAFVIIDLSSYEVYAARDRYGIKPLYWAENDGIYLFSSEIRPMYETGIIRPDFNSDLFDEFLIFGYIAGKNTLHKQVKKIEPGHFLHITRDRVLYKRYWYPCTGEVAEITLENAISTLREKLQDAIQSWLLADVDVGSMMSGGIDSSTITVYAKKSLGSLVTFSVTFPDDSDIDESYHIRTLVKELNLNNFEIPFDEDFFFQSLIKLANHFDEPILDPNTYTLMALCQYIRETTSLKVVLCGEGADEVFGGYERHRTLSNEYNEKHNDELFLLGNNRVALPRMELIKGNTNFAFPERSAIVKNLKSTDPINRILEYDQLTYLTVRLDIQDRIGMLFGLEVRTPFLDHHLTEFVNSLPGHFKVSPEWSKYILRLVSGEVIPSSVAWERKKTAMSFPYSRMLYSGRLKKIFQSMVLDQGILTRYYSKNGINTLLKLHNPSVIGQDHSNTLWRILALELWLRSWNKYE